VGFAWGGYREMFDLIISMSRIGRNFLKLSMRICGNLLPSVLLGRIDGKFFTTNSYAARSMDD
jgi:hypothetical protein